AHEIIGPVLEQVGVYLAADLASDHIIVTGDEAAIEALRAELREQKIPFHALPEAIAYHTPLVSNLIAQNNADFSSIEVGTMSMPMWACSRAAVFPNTSESIRESLTNLFAEPIRLKQTI